MLDQWRLFISLENILWLRREPIKRFLSVDMFHANWNIFLGTSNKYT
jgi:hypothetical protein